MPTQLGLPAALKRWGLTVELVPGWETRGATAFTPKGALSHWTAGPRGSKTRPSLNICTNGRSDLPGPLCQVYLDRNGVAVVVSGNRANHAGAGNWKGLTGNSVLWGTEAEAADASDFTQAQRWAYPRVNAAYATLSGFGADMVAGHSEFALPAGRKQDINGYTMAQMREQVAALLASPSTSDTGDVMNAAQEAKLDDLLRKVGRIDYMVLPTEGPYGGPRGDVLTKIGALQAGVGALMARDPDVDIDPAALAEAIKAGGSEEFAREVAAELRRILTD